MCSLRAILENGCHMHFLQDGLDSKYLSSYWSAPISILSCFYQKRKLSWPHIPSICHLIYLPASLLNFTGFVDNHSHHATALFIHSLIPSSVFWPYHSSEIILVKISNDFMLPILMDPNLPSSCHSC